MNLYKSLFPLQNSVLLLLSLALGIISIYLSYKNKDKAALLLLFFAGFILRIFVAHLDPFLHNWDECFHALVARNMMHDPFKPMLRVNDALNYDYRQWCCNHIWLHKQPLFLWQMALSMKIFGVSEFAIRYPGVLMGSISILLVYRVCYRMTLNKHISFMAAVLTCFSYFQLELLSGMYGMDQNDTAFDFYVLCSIWSCTEYLSKKTLKYALLTGLFVGCAVLNKWLVGTLVFSAWGIILLAELRKPNFKINVLHFLTALLVSVLVFLPWQLYIFHRFPQEARWEFDYNALHLKKVVEGHGGDNWVYLNDYFGLYFGNYLAFVLPIGLFLLLYLKKYRNKIALSLCIYFLLCFVFYSFIVPTKVGAYFMIVVPVGYIFIAVGVYHLLSRFYKYLYLPVLAVMLLLILNLSDITYKHDPKNELANNYIDWSKKAHTDSLYRNINQFISPNVKLVMNVKDCIGFMFYNNQTDAYSWVLSDSDFAKFRDEHKPVAVFLGAQEVLPAYIANYDSLYIIRAEQK